MALMGTLLFLLPDRGRRGFVSARGAALLRDSPIVYYTIYYCTVLIYYYTLYDISLSLSLSSTPLYT